MDAILNGDLCLYETLTKIDIKECRELYPDLRLKSDNFVFNDGIRAELMCLDGSIPVTYKGVIYNIPICIWLMDSYPYNPPMVYVKPTSNMKIKPGRHVDTNGRIYLPYLHDWKYVIISTLASNMKIKPGRQPESNLVTMVDILTIIFSEEPPVFTTIDPQETRNRRTRTSNIPHFDFIGWATNAELSDTTCDKLVLEELVTPRVLVLLDDSDVQALELSLGQKKLFQLALQELKQKEDGVYEALLPTDDDNDDDYVLMH